MSWQTILKTFIIGTERSPLAAQDLEAFGLPMGPDPVQSALEGLSAAHLVRLAAFPLSSVALPAGSAAESETHPVCSEAAANDLRLMLRGRYAEAIPEFLDLMQESQRRLPPESFPILLEKAERDAGFFEKIRKALGARGEWLARQNPRWQTLLAPDETDWFTADFAARKSLLRQTRARNPLLASAWLEKTWQEEKTDHKVAFLQIMQIRLSPTDEPLLEKAFSDKNREVRQTATGLLLRLPESRVYAAATTFFREKIAGVFQPKSRAEAEAYLKAALPDLSDATAAPWLAVLSKSALTDWRTGLVHLFVRLLPPALLPEWTGLNRERILERIDDLKGETALAEALVNHDDASWTPTVLKFYSRNFRHSIWQTKEMGGFLTRFAPEMLDFMGKNDLAFNYDNQAILRALENYRQPWPRAMLEQLLEQYRRPAYGNGDVPGWHFASVLHTAAFHCRPSDVADTSFVRDYLYQAPKARPREMEEFLGIVRFRMAMLGHLSQP